MLKLSQRQRNILDFIKKNAGVGNQAIKFHLEKGSGEKISRITVVRDVEELLRLKLIKKDGRGRSVNYSEFSGNELLQYYDIEKYFDADPDKRIIKNKSYNFKIYSQLKNFFSPAESLDLKQANNQYRKNIKKLSPAILKKELERLMIELIWKSSQIEGNTYSLIDTEVLIKERKEASGHNKEEATMILNHKYALDYIFSQKNKFKRISVRQIEAVHELLIKGLGVSKGPRKNLVGIIGTNYKPLDNQYQIKESLEKTVKAINKSANPLEKALVANLMLAYIQPFEDGNKRTSRLIGNALLLANGYCPLSFRSIDESAYKKAMILFYEQNSAYFFKELFVEQFKFAVNNYFAV